MIQKKCLSLAMCTVILFFTTSSINSGVHSFFEGLIFGSSIIQSENQELCSEAANFLDVSEDHQLYYSRWPWNYFSSFTQFTGTWVDKEVWDNLGLQEKIFIIYHEISHKALKHPIKQYAMTLGTFIVSTYFFHKLVNWGRKPSDHFIAGMIAQKWGAKNSNCVNRISEILDKATTIFVGLVITLIASSSYSRQCEQEADEKAIEALCLQERNDIIEHEINYLKQILRDHGNIKSLWFPSVKDQIQYFEDAFARCS